MIAPVFSLVLLIVQQVSRDDAFHDTTQFYEACQSYVRIAERAATSDEDWNSANLCVGYIQGYATGTRLHDQSICTGHVSFAEVAKKYIAHMQRSPELFYEPKETGFEHALVGAYPCQVAKK